MKNKLLRVWALGALVLGVTLQSCTKDDDTPANTDKNYQAGVLITNEGPFQSGTGSVSFWSRDNQVRENDIFNAVNGFPLGNIVQSVSSYYGKSYVVVNNANKIEVVTTKTFKSLGTVTGLALPRYFVALNEQKGYVSEWVSFSGAGRISVIDLNTYQVTKTITVGILPEELVVLGNKLFVANSNDSTVSVINTQTDEVENTVTVGDWPSSLVADQNGNLWVLCGGIPSWTGSTPTSPELVKFNPASPNAQTRFNFNTPDVSASQLTINGTRNTLYYLYNSGVYSFDINASQLNSTPVISRYFYSFGVDPVDGSVYGADALDFVQPGKVVKYTSTYTAVDSFTTDVIPGNFWFLE